jgi:hypothetical protein
MGLTIHYKVQTQRRLNPAAVGELIGKLRARAVLLGFEQVSELIAAGARHEWIYYRPAWAKKARDRVPPHDGWFFAATPGDGCESVEMGLCRFAGAAGWRMEGFCKTQYASRHGWSHFLRCHSRVVQLLQAARDKGLVVEVEDEGGFWETGSVAVLNRNLREYDESVAALGGALKDAAEAQGGTVSGPIFNHPEFEHFEAAGMASHGTRVARVVAAVKGVASRDADAHPHRRRPAETGNGG